MFRFAENLFQRASGKGESGKGRKRAGRTGGMQERVKKPEGKAGDGIYGNWKIGTENQQKNLTNMRETVIL